MYGGGGGTGGTGGASGTCNDATLLTYLRKHHSDDVSCIYIYVQHQPERTNERPIEIITRWCFTLISLFFYYSGLVSSLATPCCPAATTLYGLSDVFSHSLSLSL